MFMANGTTFVLRRFASHLVVHLRAALQQHLKWEKHKEDAKLKQAWQHSQVLQQGLVQEPKKATSEGQGDKL